MEWFLLIVYGLCLVYVLTFSLAQVNLTWQYRKYLKAKKKPGSTDVETELPYVTVQLPVYNERYVAERLVEAVSRLKYPRSRLEIQVLDDSTDDTSEIIDRIVATQDEDLDITIVRRTNRTGYKAGALQNGLSTAKGKLIAVFDADFVPGPEFLLNTVPYFRKPSIGMVQTRWGHLNEEYSLITKAQAFGLNAHFLVEQVGRSHSNSFINFNGTAGIWRKSCILDAGGWQSDTLTEDLDLSYRAQMNGWDFKYLEEEISPAELPILMSAVKSQQYRWNKGAAETARKLLWIVLRSPMKINQKINATFHLLNSSVYVPLILLSILSVPALYIKHSASNPEIALFFNLATIFVLGFAGIAWFYWSSMDISNKLEKTIKFSKRFPVFMSFYVGLSFHNALAVVQGFAGRKSGFVRTPKFNVGIEDKGDLHPNVYVKSELNWITIAEGILGLYFMVALLMGIYLQDFGLVPFHLLLSTGFIWIFYLSLKGRNDH